MKTMKKLLIPLVIVLFSIIAVAATMGTHDAQSYYYYYYYQYDNNSYSNIQSSTSTIQPTNTPTFPSERIRTSYLPDGTRRPLSESINIVLMGDGFLQRLPNVDLCPQGRWPNPREGTVVWHANRAIEALERTPPFDAFKHLFNVYVVQVSNVRNAAGRLGSVTNNGVFRDSLASTYRVRIRDYAHQHVPREYLTMVQVISNARGSSPNNIVGFAYTDWFYGLEYKNPVYRGINIAVTSLRTDSTGGANNFWQRDTDNAVTYTGTAWHGTFIHEFGHSFGNLRDNRPTGYDTEHRDYHANTQSHATVYNSKWRHWFGHRGVANAPQHIITRPTADWTQPDGTLRTPWYTPSAFVRNFVGNITAGDCIMVVSHVNNRFNGVSQAELTRRLALISGETFIGRSPVTGNTIANTLENRNVTIRENEKNRILDSAFHGNTILTTLAIPATINYIGDFAFLGTTNLRTIINKNPIPQAINKTTFANSGTTGNAENTTPNQLNRNLITVRIPAGTYTAYRNAGWTGFNLIENHLYFTRISAANTAQARLQPGTAFDGHIEIPTIAYAGGAILTVTAIAAQGFDGFMGHGVILPTTITYIGYGAFANTPQDFRVFSRVTTPTSQQQNWNLDRPIYFFRAWQSPTDTGRAWRMDNGVPTPWQLRVRVSFNTGDYGPQVDSLVLTYQGTYGELPTAQRVGYIFTGWVKSMGNNEWSEVVMYYTIITIAQDHTLYATWEEEQNFNNYFEGGHGTTYSPWLISSYQQLQWLGEKINGGNFTLATGHFRMMGDVSAEYNNLVAIGAPGNPFRGAFDGDGYVLSEFNIGCGGCDYQGVFGYVSGGTIKNLRIRNGFVAGRNYVGGVAGAVRDGVMVNVFNDGDDEYSGGVFGVFSVGGIVGKVKGEVDMWNMPQEYGTLIDNVFNTRQVVGALEVGGIAGTLTSRANVFNSANTGRVMGDIDAGGIVGRIHGVFNVIANNSNKGDIGRERGAEFIGGIAGRSEPGIFTGLGNCIVNNFNAGSIYFCPMMAGMGHITFGGIAGRVAGADNVLFNYFFGMGANALVPAFGQACISLSWQNFAFDENGYFINGGPHNNLYQALNLMVYNVWMIGIWGQPVHSAEFLEWVTASGYSHFPKHNRAMFDGFNIMDLTAKNTDATSIIIEWLLDIIQKHEKYLLNNSAVLGIAACWQTSSNTYENMVFDPANSWSVLNRLLARAANMCLNRL